MTNAYIICFALSQAVLRVFRVKQTERISLRLDEELSNRIKAVRKTFKPAPSGNWIIRHLLGLGLDVAEKRSRNKINGTKGADVGM